VLLGKIVKKIELKKSELIIINKCQNYLSMNQMMIILIPVLVRLKIEKQI